MIDKINKRLLNLKFFRIPIINKIYLKIMNREIVLYLIFGVITTLINILIFWLFTNYIFTFISNESLNISLSNIVAFIMALIFAFITNKNIVFTSKTESKKELIYEIFSFTLARIITFAIDTLGILLFVNILYINKLISKIIFNIIVIILNYVFSKLFVFKKWLIEIN